MRGVILESMEMIALLAWVVSVVGCVWIAQSKRRGTGNWFLVGVLLGPFGLLFAVAADPVGRRCPDCGTLAPEFASVCGACHHRWPKNQQPPGVDKPTIDYGI